MKIKIITCSYAFAWYKNLVGSCFDINNYKEFIRGVECYTIPQDVGQNLSIPVKDAELMFSSMSFINRHFKLDWVRYHEMVLQHKIKQEQFKYITADEKKKPELTELKQNVEQAVCMEEILLKANDLLASIQRPSNFWDRFYGVRELVSFISNNYHITRK